MSSNQRYSHGLRRKFFIGRDIYKFKVYQRYFQQADRRLGTYLFGNAAGFNPNLAGRLAERKAAWLSDYDYDETDEQAEHCRQFGYVDLGTPYDDDYIQELSDRFDELITDDESRRPHQSDEVTDEVYAHRLRRPVLDYFPEAKGLISDDIVDVIRNYYRSYMQVLYGEAYRTYHIPENLAQDSEVYNDNWHFDGKSTDHLKLFVCLSDVTEDDGPFHLMPRPDTERISREYPAYDRQVQGRHGGPADEIGEPVTLTGEAGTAMIANTQYCLHRAGVPVEGRQRDLIQFYIAPSSKPMGDDWHQNLHGPSVGHLTRLLEY